MDTVAIVLAALYLRGFERAADPPRRSWPIVVKVLRREGGMLCDAAAALQRAGCWGEAAVLDERGVLERARQLIESKSVLTAVDQGYPGRWASVLGAAAPPALWEAGSMPTQPFISIVGSRKISRPVHSFCRSCAEAAVDLGYSVVSGGAEGCDRAAAAGAGEQILQILPHGLSLARPGRGCQLSVCAPGEPFSSRHAMERNVLIYAASSHTIVGHARFKEGGTWHGAVESIRRRLGRLLVRASDDLAARSLVSLGGAWLGSAEELGEALGHEGPQRELFEIA